MSTRYFRAGVGTVIYNETGRVAFFRRAQEPVGIWQFQQGGIDHNESTENALWRELEEEVGLSETDVTVTYKVPHLISYIDLHASTNHSIERLGQTHQWYFLKLNENVTINLDRATDKEFDEWRFVTCEEAARETSPHKQHVYQTLEQHLKIHLEARKNQS